MPCINCQYGNDKDQLAKAKRLLANANSELEDMTMLDCPEYVTRDESLELRIREFLDS